MNMPYFKTANVVSYYKQRQRGKTMCSWWLSTTDRTNKTIRSNHVMVTSLVAMCLVEIAVRLSPAAVPLEFTHHLRCHTELAAPDAHHISTYRALPISPATQYSISPCPDGVIIVTFV